MPIFAELKRRNVFRVAIAYALVTWLLLQIVDVVAPLLSLPDWIARAIFLVLLIGFPIALLFAWAFEVTPQGIKPEKKVDRSESIVAQTGRKLDRLIIVVLLLVIGVLIAERTMFVERVTEEPIKTERSVAVLPFADMSEGGDQEWFADGLAEEILNALARTPDLLVSSRTSSFAYKGSDKSVPVIATELGVAHVLEGSVRRAGDRLRVTAQLIRARDGFHVWSENFDRSTTDVIALQEELAVSIANALNTTMDPAALEKMLHAGTRSVEAYELYLEGLALSAKSFVTADFDLAWDAYDAFERAREIDPGFSDAHAKSANTWLLQLSISTRVAAKELPLAEMMANYRERMNLAITTAQNPVDKERHQAQLALTEMRLREAARLFQSVLEQRPYDFDVASGFATTAIFLSDRRLLDSAMAHVYSNWENGGDLWAINYAANLYRIGGKVDDPDQFVDRLMQAIQRFPTPGMAYQVHRSLLWMGEVDTARTLLPLMEGVSEGARIVAARQACAEGRREDAEAALNSIDPSMSSYDRAALSWHILMLLERQDEAMAMLKPFETMASPHTIGAYLVYPQFDPEPFPIVMDILRREGVQRPPPVKIPFACPPGAES